MEISFWESTTSEKKMNAILGYYKLKDVKEMIQIQQKRCAFPLH